MPLPGVPPARPRPAAITAAAFRIRARPQEAMVTIHTLVLPPRRDATETPTLAATPAPATMATVGPLTTGLPPAERAITAAIRLEATAPTTMAEAMVAEASMRQRSADRMATSMHRGFIAGQFGEGELSGYR